MGGVLRKIQLIPLFILVSGALVLGFFQNCARPGEQDIEGFVYESLNERTEVEAMVGESITLTLPLTQLPVYDENFVQEEALISWTFISPIGKQSPLFHEEPQLILENLTPQESGTYRGRIEYRNQAYQFNYRLQVREPLVPAPEVRGNYQHEYINPLCTPNLDRAVTNLANITFAEAQQRCEEFSRQVANRQNRAINCRFNGEIFRSVPSTATRDVFVGQERPAANQAFQNLVTLNDLTECQARVQCYYFRQGQLTRTPPSLAANLQCQWGSATITQFVP